MKAVAFKGTVPQFIKPASIEEAAAKAPSAKTPSVKAPTARTAQTIGELLLLHFNILKGLEEHDTWKITHALCALLKCPDERRAFVSDEEFGRVCNTALKHLVDESGSDNPCRPSRPIQSWPESVFIHLGSCNPELEQLGCYDNLFELQSLALSESGVPYNSKFYLHKAIWSRVGQLHATNPAQADEFELQVVAIDAEYAPMRSAPWQTGATPMNRDFALRAIPLLDDGPLLRFLGSCDLDWLPEELAFKAIFFKPNKDACKRYSTATPKTIGNLLAQFAEPDVDAFSMVRPSTFNVKGADLADAIARIPAWQDFAADLDQVRHAFKQNWLTLKDGVRKMEPQVFECMAHMVGAGHVGAQLGSDMLKVSIQAIVEASTRGVAVAQAEELVDIIKTASKWFGFNLAELHGQLLELDVMSNQAFCPEGEPLLGMTSGAAVDMDLNRFLRNNVDADYSDCVRAAFIDAGIVNIGSLAAADQGREALVGAALRRRPERLSEIKDLERFIAVAKKFDIPVDLPPHVVEAYNLQDSMSKAAKKSAAAATAESVAADPLAHTPSSPARPKRRARP